MRTINKLEEIAALDCACTCENGCLYFCKSCKAGTYLNSLEEEAALVLEELENEGE
jgi:hypothetical protein